MLMGIDISYMINYKLNIRYCTLINLIMDVKDIQDSLDSITLIDSKSTIKSTIKLDCDKCVNKEFHFCPDNQGDYIYPRFSCCGIFIDEDNLPEHKCEDPDKLKFINSGCTYEDCNVKGNHYCEYEFGVVCCNEVANMYYDQNKGKGYECRICGYMTTTCTTCGNKLNNPWRRYHGKCLTKVNDEYRCIYCRRKRMRHLADMSDSDCSCDGYNER